MTGRPLASVSLDLDNLWSYLKTHGDPGWEARPTYLPDLVPLALSSLSRHRLHITFFIVGRDAQDPRNADALRSIVAEGHEVGNHSHEHEPWLHQYAPEALEAEVTTAENLIASVTGQRPTGFRGPGFSWSPMLLEILAHRGYQYDASTFPTFIGPLARRYYFRTAKLSADERAERDALFGSAREGFRPNRPYQWNLPSGRQLLEMPVTTMPGFRMPFHLSYLLFLAGRSQALMDAYLASAIALCRATGTEPSFLLHPLDLLGPEDAPALTFFPGMELGRQRKAVVFSRVMDALGRHFELVSMGRHARALLARAPLPARVPELAA